MQNIKQILPAVIMAAGLLNADNLYQDPQSRFANPVPAGWTQSAGEGTVQLVRNEAYVTLIAMPGAGRADEVLSEIVGTISRQWRNLKPIDSPPSVTLGGLPAAFKAMVGTNPRGVQSFAVVYAAATGSDTIILIESGPISQYGSLAPEMDRIAAGVTIAAGGRPVPPQGVQCRRPLRHKEQASRSCSVTYRPYES